MPTEIPSRFRWITWETGTAELQRSAMAVETFDDMVAGETAPSRESMGSPRCLGWGFLRWSADGDQLRCDRWPAGLQDHTFIHDLDIGIRIDGEGHRKNPRKPFLEMK